MRFVITGRNIEVTDGLRAAVEDKLGKLDRFFMSDTEVIVTLSVEKERQKIEVTIPVKGNIIRSEQVSNDMYVSIDLVEEIIERQLKKYKHKIIDQKQNQAAFAKEFVEKDFDDEAEVQIIRTKKFGVKPMDPEEACVQMELLGHNFFVFFNSETEEINVVYKRKGNTYGLIEPEFQQLTYFLIFILSTKCIAYGQCTLSFYEKENNFILYATKITVFYTFYIQKQIVFALEGE